MPTLAHNFAQKHQPVVRFLKQQMEGVAVLPSKAQSWGRLRAGGSTRFSEHPIPLLTATVREYPQRIFLFQR